MPINPEGELTLQTVTFPADTNSSGDIFGGWVLSQMDIAAGTTAAQRAKGRCATIAINEMRFHAPVHVGDLFSVYTHILKTGKTSITIHVESWVRRQRTSPKTSYFSTWSSISPILPAPAGSGSVDLPDYRVVPNAIDRFNFNSYSPLEKDADSGVSMFIAPAENGSFPFANWLPSAEGKPFSLTFRTYVPKEIVKAGNWFPPKIRKLN